MVLKMIAVKGCPHCEEARKFMQDEKIPFEEIDFDSPEGKAYVNENKLEGGPVIINECNEGTIGFDKEEIKRLAGSCKKG